MRCIPNVGYPAKALEYHRKDIFTCSGDALPLECGLIQQLP
jgi:hypothetical protein